MVVQAITFDNYKTLTFSADDIVDIMPPVLERLEEKGGRLDGFMTVYRKLDERYTHMKNTLHVEPCIKAVTNQALYELGYLTPSLMEHVDETFEDYQEERGFNWYPDAHETIERLREKGYRLGLISNISWPVPRSMRKAMDNMFDVVTYSLEHGMRKPNKAIFLDTLRLLGAQPHHSVHVGDDYEADIVGAKNVGMKAVHIQREVQSSSDSDYIIQSLSELTKLL